MNTIRDFDDLGFANIGTVITAERCADMAAAIDAVNRGRVGSWDCLHLTCCQELAAALKTDVEVGRLLPPGAVAVQCTLFDKSTDKNWLVALHQDLSIPVRERVPHPECTGWSEKDGVTYVQPPVSVLEALVAVRVHLDDCGAENGPLRVVPKSHRHGRLSADAAQARRQNLGEVEFIASRGGAIAMRPLLLHSSSKARSPSWRRVVHFLFGRPELPCGLRWHCSV